MSTVESVQAPDWSTWIADTGGRILDIREPWEWEQGTLPGSITISMGDLPGRMAELDPDQALLVVCRVGGRSQQVALYLTMNGFTRVANMSGGMKALGLQE
jgi:rhodanese-related sulfurtransferase